MPLVQGAYLVPSFGKVAPIAAMLERAQTRQAKGQAHEVSN
jgi:hypothetical protein